MNFCCERSSWDELFVESDVDNVIDALQGHKADHEFCRSLRMHLGRNVAAPGGYRDFKVALASLAGVHSEVYGLSDCSPRNRGYEDFGCVICFACVEKWPIVILLANRSKLMSYL